MRTAGARSEGGRRDEGRARGFAGVRGCHGCWTRRVGCKGGLSKRRREEKKKEAKATPPKTKLAALEREQRREVDLSLWRLGAKTRPQGAGWGLSVRRRNLSCCRTGSLVRYSELTPGQLAIKSMASSALSSGPPKRESIARLRASCRRVGGAGSATKVRLYLPTETSRLQPGGGSKMGSAAPSAKG